MSKYFGQDTLKDRIFEIHILKGQIPINSLWWEVIVLMYLRSNGNDRIYPKLTKLQIPS